MYDWCVTIACIDGYSHGVRNVRKKQLVLLFLIF